MPNQKSFIQYLFSVIAKYLSSHYGRDVQVFGTLGCLGGRESFSLLNPPCFPRLSSLPGTHSTAGEQARHSISNPQTSHALQGSPFTLTALLGTHLCSAKGIAARVPQQTQLHHTLLVAANSNPTRLLLKGFSTCREPCFEGSPRVKTDPSEQKGPLGFQR